MVFGAEVPGELEGFGGGLEAARVGEGVAGLEEGEAAGGAAVAVAGHAEPGEGGPVAVLRRGEHGEGGLSDREEGGPAGAGWGEVGLGEAVGVGGLEGGAEGLREVLAHPVTSWGGWGRLTGPRYIGYLTDKCNRLDGRFEGGWGSAARVSASITFGTEPAWTSGA